MSAGNYIVHAVLSDDENCFNDPVDKNVTVAEEPVGVFFGFVPGPC